MSDCCCLDDHGFRHTRWTTVCAIDVATGALLWRSFWPRGYYLPGLSTSPLAFPLSWLWGHSGAITTTEEEQVVLWQNAFSGVQRVYDRNTGGVVEPSRECEIGFPVVTPGPGVAPPVLSRKGSRAYWTPRMLTLNDDGESILLSKLAPDLTEPEWTLAVPDVDDVRGALAAFGAEVAVVSYTTSGGRHFRLDMYESAAFGGTLAWDADPFDDADILSRFVDLITAAGYTQTFAPFELVNWTFLGAHVESEDSLIVAQFVVFLQSTEEAEPGEEYIEDYFYQVPFPVLVEISLDGTVLSATVAPDQEILGAAAVVERQLGGGWQGYLFLTVRGAGLFVALPLPDETGHAIVEVSGSGFEARFTTCLCQVGSLIRTADEDGYLFGWATCSPGVSNPCLVRFEEWSQTWGRQNVEMHAALALPDGGDLVLTTSGHPLAATRRVSAADGAVLWATDLVSSGTISDAGPTYAQNMAQHLVDAGHWLSADGGTLFCTSASARLADFPALLADPPPQYAELVLEDCSGDDPYYYDGSSAAFRDTFTDADFPLIEDHVSDSGHRWTAPAWTAPATAQIVTNTLAPNSDPYVYHFASLVTTDVPGEQIQVTLSVERGPSGILFRSITSTAGYWPFGEAATWAAAVEFSDGEWRVALYNTHPLPRVDPDTSELIWPTPVDSAVLDLEAITDATLTVHDDGEWIGVDFNGVRKITHQSTTGAERKRIGLFATGFSNTFDTMTAVGRSGCSGTDEWTWNGSEWEPASGDCPDPCTSLPPIQPGTFVSQTLPGRCGNWE